MGKPAPTLVHAPKPSVASASECLLPALPLPSSGARCSCHCRRLPCQVAYTVDSGAPEGWAGFTGHISADMARKALLPLQQGSGSSSGNEQGGDKGAGAAGGKQGVKGGQVAEGGQEHGQGEGQGQEGVVVSLLCGPPPMLKYACRPALQEMGFPEEHVLEF